MPINYSFPPVNFADEDGVIAVGGDLNPQRLLAAYQKGIFPWPHEDYPLLWFCPDPRFVLYPHNFHLPKSLAKAMRKTKLSIRADGNFSQVIHACSHNKRTGQQGTWINDEIIAGYCALHEMGFAHSIEAYDGETLVGGLYGVCLGKIFFGESMFSLQNDASKIAFATLIAQLIDWDFELIDCQAYTEHLQRFGALEIKRSIFIEQLKHGLAHESKQSKWQLYCTAKDAVNILLKSKKIE